MDNNNVTSSDFLTKDGELKNVTNEQEKKIKEHYDNPKNNFALKEFNARGIGRNPDNWGQVDMYLLIDENEILQDLGYEYKGCPTISFTASVFTEELKGVSLKDGLVTTKISLDEINAQENCDDCIKMILVAFMAAYENYQNIKNGIEEEYVFKTIETTVPYTQQSCN